MCSECSQLLLVRSDNVSPEQNLVFVTKCKMAAMHHVEVIIPELFDIYFNVTPHFNMIFYC